MKYVSKSLAETEQIATDFLATLTPSIGACVVALVGDLGSGKTTFSQCVGRRLGVNDPMQSPTFLIEKIYELTGQSWKHLIHIDTYRLEQADELVTLGWKKIVADPSNLILVEWADKINELLPSDAHHLAFTFIDETTREVDIQS